MSLLLEARQNLSDARRFGPSFLLRHFGRLTGRDPVKVSIPGAGQVYIRQSESDLAAFRQIFAFREYDLPEGSSAGARARARFQAIIDSGKTPVIVDAGANVGAASLWFRYRYPQAAIVAVEPEPGNVAILRRNLAGREKTVILEAAIGAASGFVKVVNDGLGWAARTVRASKGTAVVTVDQAAKSVADGELFLVKIDIEGFEKDLFSANIGWLDHAYIVIIEPHDWMLPGQRSSGPFQKAMGDRDFELLISGENLIYVRA